MEIKISPISSERIRYIKLIHRLREDISTIIKKQRKLRNIMLLINNLIINMNEKNYLNIKHRYNISYKKYRNKKQSPKLKSIFFTQ